MRFAIVTILLAFLFALVLAAAPQKAIVVSYEDPNTPQSVVDEAMDAIKKAGGIVTHEYTLFKGFAAKASEAAIEAVHALESEFAATVEQDITFSTQDA